jgi:hypothetical protein
MTGDEYFAEVNRLLRSETNPMIGPFCLGFSAVAHIHRYPVTAEQLDSLYACANVADGIELAESFWGEDFWSAAKRTSFEHSQFQRPIHKSSEKPV